MVMEVTVHIHKTQCRNSSPPWRVIVAILPNRRTDMEQKLIERIKKMFALANNEGAAPGEAENAMRMANKLMEKHQISSFDLHTKEEIIAKFCKGSKFLWVAQLYQAVAKVYSCSVFKTGSTKIILVGAEGDAVTAKIVIESLILSIDRAGKGKAIAFKNGAALELCRQCREIIHNRKIENQKIPGTELALTDIYEQKYQNAVEFMHNMTSLTTGKAKRLNSSQSGIDYGKTLNPHTRVGAKTKALN